MIILLNDLQNSYLSIIFRNLVLFANNKFIHSTFFDVILSKSLSNQPPPGNQGGADVRNTPLPQSLHFLRSVEALSDFPFKFPQLFCPWPTSRQRVRSYGSRLSTVRPADYRVLCFLIIPPIPEFPLPQAEFQEQTLRLPLREIQNGWYGRY